MKKILLLLLFASSSVVWAKTYYVAPTGGSDSYSGTKISEPWATWQKAFNTATNPGDTVFFLNGVWTPSGTGSDVVSLNGVSGTHDRWIVYTNYPGATPVLDCKNYLPTGGTITGLSINNCSYIKFKGLTIKNRVQSPASEWIAGVLVSSDDGDDNSVLSFERCVSTGHGGSGYFIASYDTLYLINCDSYNNCDPIAAPPSSLPGGRADGFNFSSRGIASDTTKMTYVTGCRSWFNSDDGFDCATTKQLDLHNCWSFRNGRLSGDGDGYKLSYSNVQTNSQRQFHNNISAYNNGIGISELNLTTPDYGPRSSIYNNLIYKCIYAYLNAPAGFECSSGKARTLFKNNIFYALTDPTYKFIFNACENYVANFMTADHNNLIPTDTYPYYSIDPTYNVTDADFVSLDTTQLRLPRKADGSLPDVTFGHLVSTSDLINQGINVGLPYSGSAPDLGAFEYSTSDPNIKLITSIKVSAAGGLASITTDNGTLQLSATILPADATNKTVTWSITTGADKASISSTGLVTAIDNGTATARATANDGSGVSGTLTVTISNQVIPVTSISVTGVGGATTISTDNGTLQLSANLVPANATNKTITWSIISGTDKASISSTGLVTALDNGTATARATANDGSGIFGILTITISNQLIQVSSITVAGAGGASTIATDNGSLQLNAVVLPSNATNKTLTWSISSGADKASISSAGLVSAIDNGTVVARASATDGSGIYGSLTITISNQVIPVTSISVTGAGGATLITRIGGTLQLSAAVLPANATNKALTWSISSGIDKASINSSGLVTALDNGTTIAKATANDGSGVYGTLTITISNQVIPVSGITVSGAAGASTITADNGTLQLNAAVIPANASNRTVSWSITNGSAYATINSSTGLLTAVENGSVTVRATANDGSGIFGELTITISNQVIPVSNITVTGEGGASTITTENGTIQLSASVLPANASNKTVTWSISSGSNLASINTSTGLVTAKNNGTITVRATANDGSGIYGIFIITISYIANSPPVIVVNYKSSSYSGFVSEINASGSYDVNRDNLTYTWVVPNNIPVSSLTESTIKYLGPVVNTPLPIEFTLQINDGKSTQSKVLPIEILPYKPELEVAEISNIEASSFQPPFYPYNIVDGNIGTMWSADGTNQWLIIELKHSFSVQHVKLAFQPGQRRESYFDILGSVDKVSWEPIFIKSTSCAFSGDLQVFEFPPSKTGKEYNYIKLIGLGNSTDTWNYISELKIFGYRYRNSPAYENLPVKIYPNPARKFVTIRIDESTLVPDFVQLTDLSGKVVIRTEVNPDIKEFTIPFDLRKGIYIVQLGSGKLTLFTQKLIVI
jgi:uncharacterized protein YjdB